MGAIDRFGGGEGQLADGGTGRSGQADRQQRPSFLAACLAAGLKLGSKQLRQVAGGIRMTAVFSVDQLLLDHVAGDLHGRGAGPLAVAGLQHVERARSRS